MSKMSKWSIGDTVTVRRPIEAYYSGYAGNPTVIIQPGVVGTVKHTDVPSVNRERVTFNCVDFILPGVYQGDARHGNNTWRIAAQNNDLKAIAK